MRNMMLASIRQERISITVAVLDKGEGGQRVGCEN